jgi:ABC-2 type transport system permease protein
MAMSRAAKVITASFKMGWKVEGNWTDPVMFVGFLVTRPLFTFFVGVFAYLFIGSVSGSFTTDKLSYIILGSALFVIPTSLMRDLGWLVHDDREHYESLKHIYLASPNIRLYLVGRSLMSLADSVVGFAVTMLASSIVIQYVLKINVVLFANVDIPMLLLTFALGYLVFTSIGFCMYGAGILSETAVFAFADGLPALMVIVGGVLFPPQLLPAQVSWLAYATPAYYFTELARESLMGAPQLSMLLGLLATSAVYALVFNLAFVQIRRISIRRGLLDRKSNW